MGLTRKKNLDNGLVRPIFGKSTDEISKPTLHWATEQLSQHHHHLVPFSAFTVQILMKVRLDEFTGDQVGQYVDRFDVLHEVVVSLNDYIMRCLLLKTRDEFQLFFHGATKFGCFPRDSPYVPSGDQRVRPHKLCSQMGY